MSVAKTILIKARTVLCCLVIIASVSAFATASSCFGQSQATTSSPRTVGDGTIFVYTPGKSETYGTSSGDIGGTNFGQPLFSRSQRWGESTGIGSSGLQTQQATAQGSPSLVQRSPNGFQNSALARPDLSHSFLAQPRSPALSGFNSLSTSPWESLGEAAGSGIFSGSGLTSPYSTFATVRSGQIAPATSLYQDDDAVPSFSGQHGGSYLPLSGVGDQTIFRGLEPRF